MVVIDAESYDEYLREKEILDLAVHVNCGFEDLRSGRTKPAEKVFDEFEKKHKARLGK